MYCLVVMIFSILITPQHISAAGPSQAETPSFLPFDQREQEYQARQSQMKSVSSHLVIENTNGSAAGEYILGDKLRIKATGIYARQIRKLLTDHTPATALKLYLDDVMMDGITPTVLQKQGESHALFIDFPLVRDPQQDANRRAWDELLGRTCRGYQMQLPVALAIGTGIPLQVDSPEPFRFHIVRTSVAWTVIAACMVIFLAAYTLLVKNAGALRETRNGQYSLGKSQMAFWGLLLVLTFTSLWILTGTMERIPQQVLILLGISGATGLSSIVIGQNKKSAKIARREARLEELLQKQERLHPILLKNAPETMETLQQYQAGIDSEIRQLAGKEPASVSSGFWRDIYDDGNGMSIHRMQVVAWTVILGAVFVRSVAQTMSMPEFPETLLLLLGISNGIYLGFKVPEKT